MPSASPCMPTAGPWLILSISPPTMAVPIHVAREKKPNVTGATIAGSANLRKGGIARQIPKLRTEMRMNGAAYISCNMLIPNTRSSDTCARLKQVPGQKTACREESRAGVFLTDLHNSHKQRFGYFAENAATADASSSLISKTVYSLVICSSPVTFLVTLSSFSSPPAFFTLV
jgi:hypothetical protein